MTHRRLSLALALALSGPVAMPLPVRADVPVQAENTLAQQLARVEQRFEAARLAAHVPGAALVVVKDGRVVLAKGFGLKDVAGKKPVTPDTLFAIGSTTKAFTAMLMAIAADERKLALDDHPRKAIPFFKLQDPEADAKVTMRDLLSHSTGVGRTDLVTVMGGLSREEMVRVLGVAKPEAGFRKAFLYNNQMFTAAGLAVGNVYGTTWETLLRRRLLAPLGMAGVTLDARAFYAAKDHAKGYQYLPATQETREVRLPDISPNAPAGAINASAHDMGRWLGFLLDRGVVNGKRLVSEAGFDACFKPYTRIGGTKAYGLGWMVDQWNGRAIAEHGGRINGFGAQVALMPDQRLGLAVLTNSTEHDLGEKATAAVWEELVGAPQKPTAVAPAAGGAFLEVGPHAALLGPYKAEGVDFKVELGEHEGHVALKVAGQPAYPLRTESGDTYAFPNLPASFRLVFKRDAAGQIAGFELQQPQGAMVFKALPRYTAPLSVEALMAKVIEAEGGAANLQKHRSMVRHVDLTFEHQGVTAQAIVKSRAPGQVANRATYFALGRRIGSAFEYCDGERAGSTSSYSPPDVNAGKALADAKRNADFYATVRWKTLYPQVQIRELGKVGDEPAYVVVKTPAEGHPVTDYVSTTSFRVLRRDTLVAPSGYDISLPVSETYSDFREVAGVVMPFKSVITTATMGRVRTETRKVEFDVPLTDREFRP